MKSLPNELTDLIGEELDPISQKNLRLTCIRFSAHETSSAKAIFKSLKLFCHRSSFNCIKAIAESDKLSSLVRHLHFYPVFFHSGNIKALKSLKHGVDKVKFKAVLRSFWLRLPDVSGKKSLHRVSVGATIQKFRNLQSISIWGYQDWRADWLHKHQRLPGIDQLFLQQVSRSADLSCTLDFLNTIKQAGVQPRLLQIEGIDSQWFIDPAGIYYRHPGVSGPYGVKLERFCQRGSGLFITGCVECEMGSLGLQPFLSSFFERLEVLHLRDVELEIGVIDQLELFFLQHTSLVEVHIVGAWLEDPDQGGRLLSVVKEMVGKAKVKFSFSGSWLLDCSDSYPARSYEPAPKEDLPLVIWKYFRDEIDHTSLMSALHRKIEEYHVYENREDEEHEEDEEDEEDEEEHS
jgi:hypothetical protein